jgi:F420-non-reducing hydrogenase iron-sulfur subunit
MRLNYPPNVKIVKMPCTGRVDVLLILRAFESGVDGVYLAGCLEGECHFLQGNLRAKKRVALAKRILEDAGIGGERVEMYNISASMGPRFAEIAREMTEKIRQLGPSPIKKKAAHKAPSSERKAEPIAEHTTPE